MKYLSAEMLIATNAEAGGAGAGVRDRGGIEAAAERPRSAFGGFEMYPTVELKAAALLHSIASTQSFFDGNKRTAWLAAEFFMELNRAPLRDVPVSHAEAFVLVVATGLFTIEQAADWLSDSRRTAAHMCKLLAIAGEATEGSPGAMHLADAFLSHRECSYFPAFMVLAVIVQIQGDERDAGQELNVEIRLSPESRSFVEIVESGEEEDIQRAHGHLARDTWPSTPPGVIAMTGAIPRTIASPRLPNGLRPVNFILDLPLIATRGGHFHVDAFLNGELLGRVPFHLFTYAD